MNKHLKRILSIVLAIILVTLFVPTFAIVADDETTATQYQDATPVDDINSGIIGEIPSIGDLDNEEPSVELQDYTTITSAIVPDCRLLECKRRCWF